MILRRFSSFDELTAAAADLLRRHLLPPAPPGPRAIMLAGGRTPLPAYRALAKSGIRAPPDVWFFLSDERHVPPDRPESNYGQLRELFTSGLLSTDRVIRVQTELELERAADRYHRDLQALLGRGTRITLGLLGLGGDGHTASLFSLEDVERGRGRLAMAVSRPTPPHRISVTPDLLAQVEEIVFLVSGPEKSSVVERLLNDPNSLPAGRAVAGARNVSLWLA